MKLRILAVLFLISIGPLAAYDIDAGRQSGMGGTVLLSLSSVSDYLACPVGYRAGQRLGFESGFQRRYDLRDLDKVYAAVGYRYRSLAGAIGLSQLGRADYYTEKLLKIAAGYKYRSLALGVIVTGKIIEIGENDLCRAGSIGLAGGIHYKMAHLGLVVDNINKPKPVENGRSDNIICKIYTEIEGPSLFSMTGRLTLEKYEKPSVGLGQYIRISGQHALFWGITGNPLTYGGGLEIRYSGITVNYNAGYHPVLGLSHNISLGYLWPK